MALTKSNKLGEDIYKKEVFYIDTKGLVDSLYSEASEFKSFLSRDLSRKIVSDLDSLLESEEENVVKKGKAKGKKNGKSGIGNLLKGNGKIREPVISFFSDKAATIRSEIEKIERDTDIRRRIHREFQCLIKKDKKEIERWLQEMSLYSPGIKHSIDQRRLSLELELIGLGKEKRISKLSLWKDLVFLRRELRELTFELQALRRIAELVENGGKDDMAG